MNYAKYNSFGSRDDDSGYSYDQNSTICTECHDINQKFDNASEFLESIRDQLYGIKDFDREILDHAISELCWLLNVKEPSGEITVHSIKTKHDKIFNFALNMSKELNTGNFYPTTLSI